MSIAFFDLDDTLLDGDSDYLWGEYLISIGILDATRYRDLNEQYFREYKAGTLDMTTFLEFQLAPLAQHPLEDLHAWRARFTKEWIEPLVRPGAAALIGEHRRQGRMIVIVTATNRFITTPIASLFGVDDLLATEPEMVDGAYTGRPSGTPCTGPGKIVHVEAWFERNGGSFDGSWFYSDSYGDLPLLQRVTHPVVVHPDERLEVAARERGWPVLDLSHPPEGLAG